MPSPQSFTNLSFSSAVPGVGLRAEEIEFATRKGQLRRAIWSHHDISPALPPSTWNSEKPL